LHHGGSRTLAAVNTTRHLHHGGSRTLAAVNTAPCQVRSTRRSNHASAVLRGVRGTLAKPKKKDKNKPHAHLSTRT
jgi:hypothetical protein